jgi:hypothetical protein
VATVLHFQRPKSREARNLRRTEGAAEAAKGAGAQIGIVFTSKTCRAAKPLPAFRRARSTVV